MAPSLASATARCASARAPAVSSASTPAAAASLCAFTISTGSSTAVSPTRIRQRTRCDRMSLLPLVLVWLHFLFSGEQWRFLHEDGSVTAAWGAKPALSAGSAGPVVSAWTWSARRAPRHVAPARVGRETFPNDRQTLTLRIVRRAGGRPPD